MTKVLDSFRSYVNAPNIHVNMLCTVMRLNGVVANYVHT
jgi:hypothetical protein